MVPPGARPYRAPMSLSEAEQEPLPPPDPPASAVAHRVYRSQHRVVAGVAGGLSNANRPHIGATPTALDRPPATPATTRCWLR